MIFVSFTWKESFLVDMLFIRLRFPLPPLPKFFSIWYLLIIIFLISQDPWGPCLECENRRHVVSLLIKFHLSLNSRSATRILSNQEALYYNYFLVYSDTSSTLVKDCINSFLSLPQKRGAHNRSSAN